MIIKYNLRKYAGLLCSLVIIASIDMTGQETIEGTMISGGIERSFRIYIPEIYTGENPVPLVLNLHGYGSDNIEQELYGDFRSIADTANFIIAHPNGTLDGIGNQFWNCFDLAGLDDVLFLSELIDLIDADYNIDPNCIYSVGMSNGGFMSYDLARSLSNRIAAVASVTGTMSLAHIGNCNPLHPVPVMQIHGTNDTTVPFEGAAFVSPIDDLVDFWVSFNNCNPTPVMTNVPDIVESDNCTAEHYVYSGGDQQSSVELYKIIDGGHSWPGAIININTTNMDFDASLVIWLFFKKYKLDMLSSIASGIIDEIEIFPNPADNTFYIDNLSTDSAVEILNVSGQVVQTSNCSGSRCEFTIEDPGIYMVKILSSGKISFGRIIIF